MLIVIDVKQPQNAVITEHMADRHTDPTWTPKCICCGPIAFDQYTRHHLIPKAHPVYAAYVKLRKGGPETVPLCKDCHVLLHRTFGAGHRFRGPMTRLSVAEWLKTMKAKQYA